METTGIGSSRLEKSMSLSIGGGDVGGEGGVVVIEGDGKLDEWMGCIDISRCWRWVGSDVGG